MRRFQVCMCNTLQYKLAKLPEMNAGYNSLTSTTAAAATPLYQRIHILQKCIILNDPTCEICNCDSGSGSNQRLIKNHLNGSKFDWSFAFLCFCLKFDCAAKTSCYSSSQKLKYIPIPSRCRFINDGWLFPLYNSFLSPLTGSHFHKVLNAQKQKLNHVKCI